MKKIHVDSGEVLLSLHAEEFVTHKEAREFRKLVHFVLGFHQNPSLEGLQRFIKIISGFHAIPSSWLKRIMCHKNLLEHYGELEALLVSTYPIRYLPERRDMAANDAIFQIKDSGVGLGTLNQVIVRGRNIPLKSLIYEDIEFLLKKHFGLELTEIFRDCFDFHYFVDDLLLRAERMDYESIIAEYLADVSVFGRDLFGFTEPTNIDVG